jgi:hypothetical protein
MISKFRKNRKMKKLYIIGLMVAGLASCKPRIEPTKPESANLDFSSYLAVGNSLTAGFADGSLYRSGQENSYPAIVAKQFALVSNDLFQKEFKQPLLPGEAGYPGPKYILAMKKGYCDNNYSATVIPFPGALDSFGSSDNIAYKGPYNNVGIPGIRCIDYLTSGYAMFNPYASRFFTKPATDRPIDEAMRVLPTFFTLWLGSNDVLGYATGGGDESGTPISSYDKFTISYDSVITIMTRYGAEGVALNIPDITAIPYFTTIPYNGLTLTQAEANDLTDAYTNHGDFRFKEGSNIFVIQDNAEPLKYRLIKPDELLLLTIPKDSIKCAGWGSKKPIPASFVLTEAEIAKVRSAVTFFNGVIAQKCAEHNTPVVDMYSYLKTVQSGISYNGAGYNATFVTGGVFSLDGVHLTPRGYALVANQIINTINTKYGSSVPMTDVNSYPGLRLP